MHFHAQSLNLRCKPGASARLDFPEVIHAFENAIRITAVAPEIEIILALFYQSPLPVTELQGHCPVSSAKFFAVLGGLRQRNIVSQVPDPSDKRRRLYDLSSDVRAHVCDELNRCAEAAMRLADEVRLCAVFEETLEAIGNRYAIAPFPFRYTILSSLFKVDHWCPNEGLRLAKTSQVSFFAAMEYLKLVGAIECFDDPADRRKKRCRLTPAARQTFIESIRAIKSRVVEYAAHRPSTAQNY